MGRHGSTELIVPNISKDSSRHERSRHLTDFIGKFVINRNILIAQFSIVRCEKFGGKIPPVDSNQVGGNTKIYFCN